MGLFGVYMGIQSSERVTGHLYDRTVRNQTIEDIAHAHTVFFEKVIERHPEAEGKPFIIGNCQAGWALMMLAVLLIVIVVPSVATGLLPGR